MAITKINLRCDWAYLAPNELNGAGDRPRTGYLNLGKVALYQVSYARSAEDRF